MAAMNCPVMLQNMATWTNRGEDSWDVYPEGHPDCEDFLRCATWRSLRCDMTKWTLVPSDTAGCVQLGHPKKIMDIQHDFRNGPVSLVVLL